MRPMAPAQRSIRAELTGWRWRSKWMLEYRTRSASRRGASSLHGCFRLQCLIAENPLNCIEAREEFFPYPSKTAPLVRPQQTRLALAPQPRSLRHLDLGNHAATNPGQNGSALLREISPRISHREGARSRARRESTPPVVR